MSSPESRHVRARSRSEADDQRIGSAAQNRLPFFELRGAALESFLAKVSWPMSSHICAPRAAHEVGVPFVVPFEEMERSHRLVLLTIEDRHTVGLTGAGARRGLALPCALQGHALQSQASRGCRRQLTAWGSQCFGRSRLYQTSHLQLGSPRAPRRVHSPRMIGRVELPSHKVGSAWYSGWMVLESRSRRTAENVPNRSGTLMLH